jgi:hypothetical protein
LGRALFETAPEPRQLLLPQWDMLVGDLMVFDWEMLVGDLLRPHPHCMPCNNGGV